MNPTLLLPRNRLIRTGPIDHADWNYRPILGRIIRTRNDVVAAMLAERHGGRLLEVGYGSGILFPELQRRCDELVGLDIHPSGAEVSRVLEDFGVTARLVQASASSMPFASESFDTVVCVSAIEFVDDVDAACREIDRILRPGGVLACVTPTQSGLSDLGLGFLTGASARQDFGDRRRLVQPTMLRRFDLIQRRAVRPVLMAGMTAYHGLLLRRREHRARAGAAMPATDHSTRRQSCRIHRG